jgi:hypothetical protein
MVTSSERRQLESWYLDSQPPRASTEKGVAGLVFFLGFFAAVSDAHAVLNAFTSAACGA